VFVLVFTSEVRNSIFAKQDQLQPSAIERMWDQLVRLRTTVAKQMHERTAD
jgi:hypothetical protein